jgi:cytochrome c-type biogenesis protein CcmH/NrfG
MKSSDHQPALWSNPQTYTMALICLMLGVVAGFLLHSPTDARPNVPASALAAPAAPGAVNPQMPSAADLKRMADKQVAPLLEQLQKNPKDADVLARIAHSYMAAQQFHSARQYYEESIIVKPKAGVLNELAFVYVKMGDLDKGIATLRQALTIDPKNANVLYNLGFYEWEGKADAKAAIEAWRSLLNVDPKNAKRVEVERMMAQAKKHLGIAPGTKTDKPAS